jgi:DNA-binding response OmpR family regulator
MPRILVVEDDRDIADLLRHYLERAGHDVDVIGHGADVLPRVRAHRPDLVILDRMLPGMDGLEICRHLRGDEATSDLPVIMVTARAEETDRIVGLELGADDYITKPFSAKEVVARVNALLRRTTRPGKTQGPPPLVYGSIRMDLERHIVTDNGRPVRLTAKEFLLLRYFLEHRGADRRVGLPVHRRVAHRRRARAPAAREAAGAGRCHRDRQAVRLQAWLGVWRVA